ncbi:hypothetical protein C8Q79DRAFT_360187 [Trametes meyenii]|nr:hypothetical protein C8Q79DRAFT_360187 [Trametes meyenii]
MSRCANLRASWWSLLNISTDTAYVVVASTYSFEKDTVPQGLCVPARSRGLMARTFARTYSSWPCGGRYQHQERPRTLGPRRKARSPPAGSSVGEEETRIRNGLLRCNVAGGVEGGKGTCVFSCIGHTRSKAYTGVAIRGRYMHVRTRRPRVPVFFGLPSPRVEA